MIFWVLGFAVGFMLWPKIRPYLHRIYVVPWFWPSVATITIGIGLGMGKGCNASSFDTFNLKELLRALMPHQVEVAQKSSPRNFTPIVANANLPDVLGNLRKRRHEDELRERKQQQEQLRVDARMALSIAEAPTLVDQVVVHGTRKGPFCHLSCAVHHGTSDEHVWDAETLPEFCRANYLPPATRFPAWSTSTFTTFDGRTMKEEKIDTLDSYCGPIPSPVCGYDHDKHPVQSYRLYWKP